MVPIWGIVMKLSIVLPAAYAAVAFTVWIDFALSPPDGLANVGLMLTVLPITLLDLALRPADAPGSFVLMPEGLGYYANHAIFFGCSVLLIAAAFWWLGRSLDGLRRARRKP